MKKYDYSDVKSGINVIAGIVKNIVLIKFMEEKMKTKNLVLSVYMAMAFMLFPSFGYSKQEFTLISISPRIFSPNGDNRNDLVKFQFDNPYDSEVSGKIYDMNGREVAGLTVSENFLSWDGKNTYGETVSSGIYIYRIEVKSQENKIFNGIIVLVK